MNVEFIEPAARELHDAIEYYDAQVPGLGRIFLGEVIRMIEIIKRFPGACSPCSINTRKATLQKFPYSLIYYQQEEMLFIIAVAHHHRKPQYWIERM